jgi:hypothetical protein
MEVVMKPIMMCAALFVVLFNIGCEPAKVYPVNQPNTNMLAACTSNTDCHNAEFCKKDTGVCAGQGVCATSSGSCVPDPVCGCDGLTYTSVCSAYDAGVSVRSLGACP